MRVGFTIIYNGVHHLEHNAWMHTVPMWFDYWVLIEGAALPGGSTAWCNRLEKMNSDDGTAELLEYLEGFYDNVVTVTRRRVGWKSKDDMVNAALTLITDACEGVREKNLFLWQLDIDEQWTVEALHEAEQGLIASGADCGCFHANHFVGERLVSRGTWGEGNDPEDPIKNAYRRLWKWNRKLFKSHEPPVLDGGNGKEILLPDRFDHYSYYFEKDVLFKEMYYKGYEGLHKRWIQLQLEDEFPQPISRLITGHWASTNTQIIKI